VRGSYLHLMSALYAIELIRLLRSEVKT